MAKTLTEIQHSPATALGPFRVADYMALPNEPRHELIFGRLVRLTSPNVLHQIVVGVVGSHLQQYAARSGGLTLYAPMDVHLADHSVVQPDIVYIAAERLALAQRWVMGAPDLLVEVVSPSTARRDRGAKLRLYAESNIREYWLVDPVAAKVEFLVNRSEEFVAIPATDEPYQSTETERLVLNWADLWREVGELARRLSKE